MFTENLLKNLENCITDDANSHRRRHCLHYFKMDLLQNYVGENLYQFPIDMFSKHILARCSSGQGNHYLDSDTILNHGKSILNIQFLMFVMLSKNPDFRLLRLANDDEKRDIVKAHHIDKYFPFQYLNDGDMKTYQKNSDTIASYIDAILYYKKSNFESLKNITYHFNVEFSNALKTTWENKNPKLNEALSSLEKCLVLKPHTAGKDCKNELQMVHTQSLELQKQQPVLLFHELQKLIS